MSKHENKEKITEKDAATAGDQVSVSRESGEETQEVTASPSVRSNRLNPKTERCWFKVMSGSRSDEKSPVFAAINGESVLIQRNQWVQLQTKYLSVFKDAVASEVVLSDDGKSSVVRDVPRFNYEIRSLSEGKPTETQVPRGF